MKNSTKSFIIWGIVILLLIFMSFLSSANGNASSDMTGRVLNKVLELIDDCTINFLMENNQFAKSFNYIFRKFLHFSGYLFLGLFVYAAFYTRNRRVLLSLLYSIVFCFILAFGSEFIQLFVDRHSQFKDVAINFMGSLFGIFFMVFAGFVYSSTKNT